MPPGQGKEKSRIAGAGYERNWQVRILFIRPENSKYETFNRELGTSVPLGLLYIAAYLRKKGIRDIYILDNQLEWLSPAECRERIKSINPDITGIYSTTPTIFNAYRFLRQCKEYKPGMLTVIGGPHASALPEEVMEEKDVDIACVGEGEQTMYELVTQYSGGRDFSKVDGIYFRQEGIISKTKPRSFITDLDSLPFPARDLLKYDRYFVAYTRKNVAGRSDIMVATRGCLFKCAFCSKAVYGASCRARSAENVVAEIKMLVEKYNVKQITFHDDALSTVKPLAMEICRKIIEEKIDIAWSCQCRVNAFDEEMAENFKRAGCRIINFGVETGSLKLLNKTVMKGIELEDALRAVRICRQHGIRVECGFIFGHPGETRSTAAETIKFAIKLNPDIAVFYTLSPLPGSTDFNIAKVRGIVDRSRYDRLVATSRTKPVFVLGELSADEMIEFQKKAFRSFYFRPKYIAGRIAGLRSFEELKKSFAAMMALIKHQLRKAV